MVFGLVKSEWMSTTENSLFCLKSLQVQVTFANALHAEAFYQAKQEWYGSFDPERKQKGE